MACFALIIVTFYYIGLGLLVLLSVELVTNLVQIKIMRSNWLPMALTASIDCLPAVL